MVYGQRVKSLFLVFLFTFLFETGCGAGILQGKSDSDGNSLNTSKPKNAIVIPPFGTTNGSAVSTGGEHYQMTQFVGGAFVPQSRSNKSGLYKSF